MKNKIQFIASILFALVLCALLVNPAFAQEIPHNQLNTRNTFAAFTQIKDIFFFVFAALKYFGWAGVVVGVAWTIFELIYQLISEDSSKVIERVRGNITKAVIIIIAGLLLMSVGFIITSVTTLLGDPRTASESEGLK